MYNNNRIKWGRPYTACGFLVAVVVITACSIDDQDRCSGDFVWNAKYLACVCPKGTEWVGKGNSCKEIAAEVDVNTDMTDAGDYLDGESKKPSGFGKSCTGTSDCSAYQANRCVPTTSTTSTTTIRGYCTNPCESKTDCSSGYSCCHCSESTLSSGGSACILEKDVSIAKSMGGCECE
jgi:hypothetical protein